MDFDTLPLLPGFRQAFRQGPDEGGAAACTDYLMERGAGAAPADVLRLYAGNPPGWLAPSFGEDEEKLFWTASF